MLFPQSKAAAWTSWLEGIPESQGKGQEEDQEAQGKLKWSAGAPLGPPVLPHGPFPSSLQLRRTSLRKKNVAGSCDPCHLRNVLPLHHVSRPPSWCKGPKTQDSALGPETRAQRACWGVSWQMLPELVQLQGQSVILFTQLFQIWLVFLTA